MADLLNFYGSREIVAKIEYIVEEYKDLEKSTVPFNAAILISNPDFENKQEINGQEYDLHNTIWIKLKTKNNKNEYRCIAAEFKIGVIIVKSI